MQTNHTLINFRHLCMAFHNFLLFQNTSYNSIHTNKQLARRIGKYAILNSVSAVHECIQISNKISIILLSPSLEIVIISSFSVFKFCTCTHKHISNLFLIWKQMKTFSHIWICLVLVFYSKCILYFNNFSTLQCVEKIDQNSLVNTRTSKTVRHTKLNKYKQIQIMNKLIFLKCLAIHHLFWLSLSGVFLMIMGEYSEYLFKEFVISFSVNVDF